MGRPRHTDQPASQAGHRVLKIKWIFGIAGILALSIIVMSGLLLHENSNSDAQVTVRKIRTSNDGPLTGTINDHDWVDLGLPSGLKWATTNVGASTPEDFGDYFAWGETCPKTVYADTNCITYRKDFADMTRERIVDQQGDLTKNHDAASSNWGNSWRMPTDEEFKELIETCKWEFTENDATTGYLITGPNNQSIFLVAAGYCIGEKVVDQEDLGDYWSATAVKDMNRVSNSLGFSPKSYGRRCYARYRGRTIRPVTE
ncbi:MAG: fibrobacter succinogenes major paralogous domain-containing protein [Muribaculaceae bacterium]|nr:fibrobacter succinogenes major paralogous domain-containing protein [Muribaculaceae bacterium]